MTIERAGLSLFPGDAPQGSTANWPGRRSCWDFGTTDFGHLVKRFPPVVKEDKVFKNLKIGPQQLQGFAFIPES